jgi:hypothetical protein
MGLRSKINELHKDIGNAWKIIERSKGYKEWILQDCDCFLVQVQFKIVIDELNKLSDKKHYISARSTEIDFNVLYKTMSMLWDEVMQQNTGVGISLNDLFVEIQVLHHKLNRTLYFVQ